MGVYIWNRLPSEYQEVEYIQSSGTQYIDTGYIPSNNTKVSLRISNYSVTSSVQYIFGTYSTWLNNAFGLLSNSSWGNNCYAIYNTSQYEISGIGNGGVHDIELSSNGVYVDGVSKSSVSGTFSGSVSMYIFNKNKTGVNNPECGSFRLYYFKIYNSGTLVRDFVPCYRKSDGVIGLYDLVNSVFYTNSGSGTFSKGSDVNNYYEKEMKNAYIGEVWTPGENTIAYYKFEGNLNDSSGNGHNLTNSGTISYNSSPVAVNLSTSNYLYFNNSDTFNHDRTYNTWAYITARNNQNNSTVFLCQGTQGTNNMVYCALDYQGKLHFGFYGEDYYGTTTSSLNQWVNVCYTYEYSTKTYKAYINGVNNLNGTKTSQYSVASGNLYMGALANNTGNTNYRIQGKIGTSVLEKTLWNADKVLNHYNNTKSNYGL